MKSTFVRSGISFWRMYLGIFLSLTLFACARHVPLSPNIKYEAVPFTRTDKSVVVLMDKDLEEMVSIQKPGNIFSDRFEFKIGQAIKENMIHALKYQFEKVNFANTIKDIKNAYDYIVEVKLDTFEFKLVRLPHDLKIKLHLNYGVYDADAKLLFSKHIENTSVYSGTFTDIPMVGVPILLGIQMASFNEKMGKLWDASLAECIYRFMMEMENQMEKNRS